ncbi:MAG: DUF4351 domain-containing protein [Thioploca sp.]|nr:DUF4351 domain-containing protein [Thioploca sp.]
MKYDITLKTLLQKAPRRLLQMLVNSQPQEILMVEYPSVKDRRPDLVVRLVDGRLYHLELQTANDITMPQRMLDYFALLFTTYQQEPFQQVLYVGNKTLSMTNHLILTKLQFEYEIIDIRHLDCQPRLESPDIEDNLLAILCRIEGHEREVVRRILYRIAQVTSKERRDLWEQLLILTGLRSIQVQELVKQEGQKMPITVDMGETIWGKELFEQGEHKGFLEGERKGKLKGEALILQRQLTKRFGSLPQWAVEKIAQAQNEQLEQWSLQLLDAETLEEVFVQTR